MSECSEGEILCELEAAVCLPTQAGTFSLRRSQYLRRQSLMTAEHVDHPLLKLVREGDVVAKRKMLAHNMYLVVDSAKHYANRGIAALDLVMEGNRGLIHALENFEPEQDLSFPAYATLCIRQNIECAIMTSSNSLCQHVAEAALRGGAARMQQSKITAGNGCHV